MGGLSETARNLHRSGADADQITALVDQAAASGAERVLERLGLQDEDAGHDIRELRTLLDAWRAARRTAWQSLVRWAVTLLVAFVLASLAIRLKLPFLGAS